MPDYKEGWCDTSPPTMFEHAVDSNGNVNGGLMITLVVTVAQAIGLSCVSLWLAAKLEPPLPSRPTTPKEDKVRV